MGESRASSAREALVEVIRAEGPIPFSRFMELALYGERGFFTKGGGAGRAGRDFLTSPETGSLFGVCVSRALDRYWEADGRPDPFVVVEAGAGSGRLAREVLRAAPECGSALRYVLVERSPVLRAEQREHLTLEEPDLVFGAIVSDADDEPHVVEGRGPLVTALEVLPAKFDGVLLANELLDNLPIDVAEFDGTAWHEIRVGSDEGALVEVPVPLADPPDPFSGVPSGARVPIPVAMREWLREAAASLRSGRLVGIDYMISADELVARSPDWLRTYRGHGRAESPIATPGESDITADVVVEQLQQAASVAGFSAVSDHAQADWLRSLGIDDLVAVGQRIWEERAHLGDLEAIAGRSRVVEAAALTDPAGLGAFRVVELAKTR